MDCKRTGDNVEKGREFRNGCVFCVVLQRVFVRRDGDFTKSVLAIADFSCAHIRRGSAWCVGRCFAYGNPVVLVLVLISQKGSGFISLS